MASAPVPERAAPTLPDEILEDIFLRLHKPADLARASAVCSSFRRAARGHGFLRRYHSLHPPPVLGVLDFFMNPGELLHAEPPHRSAPAARALAEAADFRFSFVPRDPNYNYNGRAWCVLDALDGRVLLSMNLFTNMAFDDLVVCDPLHRRYVKIPAIPRDLVQSIRCYGDDCLDFENFLAPSSVEDQKKDELSFRVICNVRSSYKVVTLVFSSLTANWRGATSISFLPDRLIHDIKLFARYYVHGCFYWATRIGNRSLDNYMLVLDPREMQLRVVNLQLPGLRSPRTAIVDAGEDKLGVVSVGERSMLDFFCKTWCNNDDGTKDWQHKIIPLPELGYNWSIVGAADGYLLLAFFQNELRVYLLELKTLLFERLHVSHMDCITCRLFASFPPPLSPPTI